MKELAQKAFDQWESVSNLKFEYWHSVPERDYGSAGQPSAVNFKATVFLKFFNCWTFWLKVDLSEKPSFWKALKPPAKDKCGELLTSLCYHPSNSILTLTLLKARNLKAKDINGKSDPYVKVWLQFGDKRIEKRKTAIYKCTLNPVFNDTFSFNVPWEKIRECSLDVMVMDFDNIGRNELIGRILLAGKNGSGASETKHWQDMITKPRQTIVQWHRLKPE
nr:PREDICTED: synaptotagmin-7 [Tribolium castaneum]|eukprot:XP_015840385.1 PREDICTED: synaptotagmin-7 [Tribolium castaneum]